MPNAGDVSAAYCPSCGASIEMKGDKGTCTYCGTVVERQGASTGQPHFTVTQAKLEYPPSSSYATFNPSPVSSRGPIIAVLFGVIGLLVAVGVGVVLLVTISGRSASSALIPPVPAQTTAVALSPGAASTSPIEIGQINELSAALPRDGTGYDLLAYLNLPNDAGISLALIDGGSHAVRWRSRPLSKEGYRDLVVAGPNMAYLTDQERLLALRLSDGAVVWEAPLAAAPVDGCHECLRLLKDHVIVLQKDGSLQGFDARSGQRTWSISLDDPPRTLPVANDRLVLLRPAEKRGTVMSLLDPASGKEVQRIEPSCPDTDFPDQELHPTNWSPLLFSPDGKIMYTIFGSSNQCAQRWDLAGGKRAWQAPLDRHTAPTSWNDENGPLLADNGLFFSNEIGNDGTLWALDASNGASHKLLDGKKRKFVPVATRDGILIVLTWPTWDSTKLSLLGLDAKTGEQRWEFKPQVKDARMIASNGHWDWRLTQNGLLMVQVLDDQQQLLVETLDPKTGTVAGQQTTSLGDSGSHVFWRAMWADDYAWFNIGSLIYAIDMKTGQTVYTLK
jgi:outer membrane protein assembly factor BamB